MSLPGRRRDELREQQSRITRIRQRIERRYALLKSFSPAMRKHFADRAVTVAMAAAGLPMPQVLSFEERVQRHLVLSRGERDYANTIVDAKVRAAVLAVLDGEPAR